MGYGFLSDLVTIVLINLVLSGDNGVVIALAVKTLPKRMRRRAIAGGAGCAVLVRVVATCFATPLLGVAFLRLIGGIVILWISVNLFREAAHIEEPGSELRSYWKAIWFIIVADITMSADNVLAIAAAAHGDLFLLVAGLGLSIPLVVVASAMLASLMDRFPVIVYAGAAILGKVGAEMILTDSFVTRSFRPGTLLRNCAQMAAAIAVLAMGRLLRVRPGPVEAPSGAIAGPEMAGVAIDAPVRRR